MKKKKSKAERAARVLERLDVRKLRKARGPRLVAQRRSDQGSAEPHPT